MLPDDFSPAGFMYLNPDVHCPSVEFAEQYYTSCSNEMGCNCPYKLDVFPIGFDAENFCLSNAKMVDIVATNRSVLNAMLKEDQLTVQEIYTSSRVIPTINQPAHVAYRNDDGWHTKFRFNDVFFACTDTILQPGDRIDIGLCMSTNNNALYPPRHIDVEVTRVDASDNMFETSNITPSWRFEVGTTYVVTGHHIYDIDRVAAVAWLQQVGNVSSTSSTSMPLSDDNCAINKALIWTSNAAFEAVRMSSWCSNVLVAYYTPISTSEMLAGSLQELCDVCVTKTAHGIVTDIVELEADTIIVASNLMARRCGTIGSPYGERPDVALEVHGAVRAEDYIVSSDARIKTCIDALDLKMCMRTVESMSPVEYATLKSRDSMPEKKYGFIAQDLLKGTENKMLVHTMEDYVPMFSCNIKVDAHGGVHVRDHGLLIGDRLLLQSAANEKIEVTVRQVRDEHTFVIDGQSKVYDTMPYFAGKMVEDFHVVNQTHMVTVLVGAVKGALSVIEELKARITHLENCQS